MPAYADEVRLALEEGIPLLERRLIADMEKAADGLRLQLAEARKTENGVEPGEPGESLDTDLVVLAVGQIRDLDFPCSESFPCIGDYQDGAGNVAQAMASGRVAAERVLASCGLAPEKGMRQDKVESSRDSGKRLGLYLLQPEPSFPSREADPSLRIKDFQEIYPTPEEDEVRALASRCLQCGRCTACGLCWFFCPDMAVRLDSQKQSVEIDVNYCKGCGLCASVCPRGVIQMREDA
jgi:2-oxoacid:acceptor oxidoreductase delta subunit (pyruvate/2-ketoisovalerate family)